MKRIALFECVGGSFPNKSDFDNYNAHILVTKMLTFHILKNGDRVEMLNLFEIEAVARENDVNTHFKEIICSLIEKLPESCWQKIVEKLNFKR
ncbi:MAG: hypothetical protein ACK5XF_03310 [Neisseriaceae bacterium]